MSDAPWTQEQVDAFNAYQRAGKRHPFTCPNRSQPGHRRDPAWGRGDKGVLRAAPNGWMCLDCDYTQDWAHDFMTRASTTRTEAGEMSKIQIWLRPDQVDLLQTVLEAARVDFGGQRV